MEETNTILDPQAFLKTISAQDFLHFGVQDIAYIKSVEQDGRTRYNVCRADGRVMVTMDAHNVALAAILNNDLEPVTLH
jgi:hypothetical protein